MYTASLELAPHFDAVVAEQTFAQAEKKDWRDIGDYNSVYVFPYNSRSLPGETTLDDFLDDSVSSRYPRSLQGLLVGLSEAKGDQAVHWVDMGPGLGVALREAASLAVLHSIIKTTGVDVRQPDPHKLGIRRLAAIGTAGLCHLNDETLSPNLVHANAEDVNLTESADLISAIELIQYLNNPLGALCNWYNQLNDHGIMLVASNHRWSEDIRQSSDNDEITSYGDEELLLELQRQNAQVAVAGRGLLGSEHSFRRLALQKIPNTKLGLSAPLVEIYNGYKFYKTVTYASTNGERPLLELTRI